MTVTEAAAALGVDARTIRHRLERGMMKGENVHPRLWMIPREEVERWMEIGKLPPGRKARQEPETS